MPRRFTKPTDVPELRQPLVNMLWSFYIKAARPSMRRIAEAIEELDEDRRNGTANPETIRRTLQGQSVGALGTVEVIFLALCELADVDPNDKDVDEDNQWTPRITHIEALRRRWNEAVDLSPMPELPRTRAEQAAQEAERARSARATQDPWASMPRGPYSDEPPF